MTSKELEVLARMTVRLLEKKDVDFVIETWKSIIDESGSGTGDSEKAEKGREG